MVLHDIKQQERFVSHGKMRIVRLVTVLLVMTIKMHPGVTQSIKCTCMCNFFARKIGELDLRENKFTDELSLAF